MDKRAAKMDFSTDSRCHRSADFPLFQSAMRNLRSIRYADTDLFSHQIRERSQLQKRRRSPAGQLRGRGVRGSFLLQPDRPAGLLLHLRFTGKNDHRRLPSAARRRGRL